MPKTTSFKTNCTLDPFEERKHTPIKGIIHKYPNRILITLTNQCPTLCPYCTRRHLTFSSPKFTLTISDLEKIKNYVLAHHQINEIILSGGEPFLVPKILKKSLLFFSSLPQIKTIRIGTRAPVSQPKLITGSILKIFSQINQPIWVLVHLNHPRELTPQTVFALQKLRQAGAILLSQTVFLANINDSFSILFKLFTQLIQIGVKPYYLFHCDPVTGCEKFIVPLQKEIKIVTQLRQHLSGLAFPLFTIEAPRSKGKIPIPLNFWEFNPNFFFDFNGKKHFLKP